MLPRILCIWSLLSIHLAITNSINCVDKSGSATSSDDALQNQFTVNITTNCSASSLTIDITYIGYHGNWFGLVFAERMTGDGNASALVYTTGKPGQAHRAIALYSYRLSSKELDASGVTYNGADSDPQEISTQTMNNTLQLTYYWAATDAVFHHNTVPLMWARGDTDHRLSFHGDNHAHTPVMIALSADTHTTTEPEETTTLSATTLSPTEWTANATTPAPTNAQEVDEWFIVGVTFIVLFCVVALILCYFAWVFWRADETATQGGYHATEQEEVETETIHQAVIEEESQ